MSRRWFIILGAVILIVVLGFLVWTQVNNASAALPQFTASDVAEAHIGTLIATVSRHRCHRVTSGHNTRLSRKRECGGNPGQAG